MSLQLSLRTVPDLPIDAGSLLPERLQGMSLDAIERLPLPVGNQSVPCGELFDVTRSRVDDRIVFTGDCRRLNFIGASMSSGLIIVEGRAGNHLGSRLRGGIIDIQGDVGDWSGVAMRRGTILIQGNAGDDLGAALPGASKGMTGGEIFVHGQVGDRVGAGMRRGLIAIGQRAGNGAGVGMIAGTICLLGGAGVGTGQGMKRGTILVSGTPASTPMLPIFTQVGTTRPVFLTMLINELRRLGFNVPGSWDSAALQCFRGDLLELGLGEIFFPVT